MIRKAFRMAVHPGHFDEYERRHSPIWQELEAILTLHGAHCYSIFLDEADGGLFGYVEIEDGARWNAITQTPSCLGSWTFMRAVMPVHPYDSARALSLREGCRLAC